MFYTGGPGPVPLTGYHHLLVSAPCLCRGATSEGIGTPLLSVSVGRLTSFSDRVLGAAIKALGRSLLLLGRTCAGGGCRPDLCSMFCGLCYLRADALVIVSSIRYHCRQSIALEYCVLCFSVQQWRSDDERRTLVGLGTSAAPAVRNVVTDLTADTMKPSGVSIIQQDRSSVKQTVTRQSDKPLGVTPAVSAHCW